MKKVELEAENASLKEQLRRLADANLSYLRLEDGHLDMGLAGPMVEQMSILYTEWFRAGGAKNYVEMSMHERVAPWDTFVLTIQRVEGKTPHQCRIEAEEKVVELQKEIEILKLDYSDLVTDYDEQQRIDQEWGNGPDGRRGM